MNNRIKSIQGLRAVLCISIILSHLDSLSEVLGSALIFNQILQGGGRIGVAYFFVLSGFLAGLRAVDDERYKIGIKRKAINFYLYHIPFLILIFPRQIWMFVDNFVEGTLSFITNALLLHSWVPISNFYFGFNGPSWFLSTLLMLVIVTPIILKVVQYLCKKSINYAIGIIVFCFMVQICLAFAANSEASRYWLYVFPPTRALDYLSGICLGFIFRNNEKESGQRRIKDSFLEITAACIFVLYFVIIPYLPVNFTWSAILMPGALLTMYVLARNKGFISKILSSRAAVYFGNNSFYYMMSHQVVFRWVGSLNNHFLHLNPWITLVISLIIVLLGKGLFDFYISFMKRRISGSSK